MTFMEGLLESVASACYIVLQHINPHKLCILHAEEASFPNLISKGSSSLGIHISSNDITVTVETPLCRGGSCAHCQ